MIFSQSHHDSYENLHFGDYYIGSDITDFEEVVRRDTEYISNWNFGLDALGALYLLEMKYLSKIATSNEPDVPNKKSELFELDNWTYHYTPMGEMFACIEGEVCQLDDEN